MGGTRRPSSHNRFVVYKGIRLTVAEACRKAGLIKHPHLKQYHEEERGWRLEFSEFVSAKNALPQFLAPSRIGRAV
jgi:hypothetical protein